jgi:hypothetical protein
MRTLKAYQIALEEETAIIAGVDASAARYLIFLHLRSLGHKVAGTGKPWPASLLDLRVVRVNAFDQWAAAQKRPRHITEHYAKLERTQLPTTP